MLRKTNRILSALFALITVILCSCTMAYAATVLKITKQPVSVTVPSGDKAKVTVTAKGDGLKYKWYYKNPGAKKYTYTSTFKKNTYSLTMKSSCNGRTVYCVITDKYGKSVKTKAVTLKMGKTLKITKQPANVKALSGKTAKVTLTASGDGLKYKWYYKNPGSSKYKTTTSFKSNYYSVSMNAERSGRTVYCVVTDKYGKSVKSKAVTLKMSTPLKITKQPATIKVFSGKTAKVSLTAQGDGLTYKWYYKNPGSSKYKLTTSFKSNSYSIKMDSSKSGRMVYCVVTDENGKTVKSNAVTLALTNLKITKNLADVRVLSGKTAKATLTATGDGLTYKWYYSNAGSSSFKTTTSFKSNYYSVSMNADRSGRKVYCVVTDKYGNSVTSKTATLSMATALKITEQPASESVQCGTETEIYVTAQGDGLTYKWYHKDKGASSYTVASSFTKDYYNLKVNNTTDGREVYCVVSDAYGRTVKSNVAVISTKHVYDDGKVTKAATCTENGEIKYTCKSCSKSYTNVLESKGHDMGQWKQTLEPTVEHVGYERQTCNNCSYFEEREISKLAVKWYITANTGADEPVKIGVAANGKYTIKNPEKIGYNFAGWTDINGKGFSSTGTVFADTLITAKWELDPTNSLKELSERTDAGVDTILIASDITLNAPVFINSKTTIYADENHTIKRAPNYTGDMFVVGRNKNNESAVVAGKKAVLNLGGGKGTLTVDGNKDALTATVVGSAFYVTESSEFNLYDGAVISNHKKLGNERIFSELDSSLIESIERAGGAAVIVLSSDFNMYGGVIENNVVKTEYTTITDEANQSVLKEDDACGAGVFNRGDFNMYGGTIRNNEALRGGGIFNDRVARLYAGTVSGNIAHVYGAGLSTSSSQNADTFIGTEDGTDKMIFSENYSMKAGSALYSNTSSAITIYGNTEFIKNRTDSSGGAIYTAGPLTIRNTVFRENSSVYSGGAIYHHYTKADFERRELDIIGCTFENNSAGLGGAVTLSAADSVAETDKGTVAFIDNCVFKGNNAVKTEFNPGNGGAVYITRKSNATITNCEFTENKANQNAGAVAMHSESVNSLTDCSFTNNTASFGGAVYTSSKAEANLKNVVFDNNSAIKDETGNGGNGGAMYLNDAGIIANNVDFTNNAAENHAGAIYQGVCTLTFDESCEFTANRAGNHGGAIYMTYRSNEDGTKTGSVLNANNVQFSKNIAKTGGAISARTACTANLNGVKLSENTVCAVDSDSLGGGAVYVGFGTLNLTNVVAENNVSDGTMTEEKTYNGVGGAVSAVGSTVTVTGGEFKNNSASSGGAISAQSETVLTVDEAIFKENKTLSSEIIGTVGGGAVYVNGSTLDATKITAENNSSGYYGGVVHARKSTVTLDGESVITGSKGATGAAIHLRESTNATLENITVSNNESSANGIIYIGSGTVNINNVTASGNKAANGGVLYTSGEATQVNVSNCSFSENTANIGGVIYTVDASNTITSTTFTSNTANLGGAVYNKKGTITLSGAVFEENSSTVDKNGNNGNGGAVSIAGGSVTASGINEFKNNSADKHGGAVYVSYVTNEDESRTNGVFTATQGTFSNNSALAGGAVSIRTGCTAEFDATSFSNNNTKGINGEIDGLDEGGGAVYVGYGSLKLKNVTADSNIAQSDIIQGESGDTYAFGFGGFAVSLKSDVTIEGGSFTQNKACSGGVISAAEKSTLNISGASFTNNESVYENKDYNSNIGGGVINISGGSADITGCVIDSNKSGYYGGALLSSGAQVTVSANTEVKNSQGATGAALYFKNSSVATLTDVTINNNISDGNGVVYANNSKVDFERVTATENTAVSGGVIYTSNANSVITVNNSTFTSNSASTKGGVAFAENAQIIFNNNTFTSNTSKNGAVINTDGARVTFNGGTATLNIAENSGGVLLAHGGTVNVTGTAFTQNEAKNNGGALQFSESSAQIDAASFSLNKAGTNAGAVNSIGSTVAIGENCSFTSNTAGGHGGAVYVTYYTNAETEESTGSTVSMTGGIFEGNTAMGGGAVSVRSYCEAEFTSTEFKNNTVTGFNNKAEGDSEGGGAVYVGYGKLTVNDITATGNTAHSSVIENTEAADDDEIAYGYGGAIAATGATVTVNGGTFENNTADCGGAVNAINNSKVAVTSASFKANKSLTTNVDATAGGGAIKVYESTLEINGTIMSDNTTGYYGGAIHSRKSTVTIDNNSSISGSVGSTGAAVYIREDSSATISNTTFTQNTSNSNGVIYANNSNLISDKLTAHSNTGVNGAVFFVSGATTATINNLSAYSNTSRYGSVLNVTDATVNLNGGELKQNTANLGGAVLMRKGNLNSNGVIYDGNKAVVTAEGKDGNGGAICVSAGTLTATGDNKFINNSAENHAGAVYVSYITNDDGTREGGVFNATGGTFENNTAIAGGAVSGRTGSKVTLTGAELKANSATGDTGDKGGGAIYANDNTLTLSGVTLKENSSAYYGGAISALNADVTINNNSVIDNNMGVTGAAIQLRTGGTCNMDTVSVTNNASTSGSGVLYVTGSAKFIFKNVTATGNKNVNGGVVYSSGTATVDIENSTISGNTATSMGGAIDHRSAGALTIKGSTISENTAKYGGALHLTTAAAVNITDTDFISNTATEIGGALYSDSTGVVTISENSAFTSNTSKKAGAIYLDLGANAQISSTEFKSNSATSGDGGAILVSESSDEGTAATTLGLSSVTFTENTASSKGGAISTDTASPNLVINAENCSFTKNSAVTAGGGAVEIQNGNCASATDPTELKLVFRNCEFIENSAKTTGGAIEIRTSSCAKLDGITAKSNKASGNGGVVYVTSNYSRLYLTGDVTLESNTATSGNFAYLYNSNYTNPPKIYTTHSNTAGWVSGVKGNTSSIAFDMTAMP